MFRNYHFTFVLAALALTGVSQQNKRIVFESGAVINKILVNQETISSGSELSTGGYYYDYTYSGTSDGYYFKLAFEKEVFSHRGWGLVMPMGMSYLTQTDKYHVVGDYSGCFSWGHVDDHVETVNTSVFIFLGTGVEYSAPVGRFSASLVYNQKLSNWVIEKSSGDRVKGYYPKMAYWSSQLTAMFKIGQGIYAGPACEVFMYEFQQLNMNMKGNGTSAYFREYGRGLGLKGNNVWINPGVKLQFEF